MDDLSRQLLLFLQNGIPLQKRPFEGIAAKLGLDSADVLLRISRLKLKKTVRQITALLDGRSLGYDNTLAAMIVPPEKMERAVFWMKAHPGVTQCSARENEFNLWFTLAVPAGILEQQIRRLHTLAGAKKTILLPALKNFKSAVPGEPAGFTGETKSAALSALEKALLRRIQEDFPLDDEPFQKLGADCGIPESEILVLLKAWTRKGYLKKITALMPSRPAGSRTGVAVVWEVPEERQDEAGARIAAFNEVADCVKRPAYPEFPYALHARVRVHGLEDAGVILGKISSAVGSWPYRLLWQAKEVKKIRLKYFSENLDNWESRAGVNVIKE